MSVKLTSKQARELFFAIYSGQEIGADGEGNPVCATTQAGLLLDFIGAPKPSYGRKGNEPGKWHVADTAQFLRDWADAMEAQQ